MKIHLPKNGFLRVQAGGIVATAGFELASRAREFSISFYKEKLDFAENQNLITRVLTDGNSDRTLGKKQRDDHHHRFSCFQNMRLVWLWGNAPD